MVGWAVCTVWCEVEVWVWSGCVRSLMHSKADKKEE